MAHSKALTKYQARYSSLNAETITSLCQTFSHSSYHQAIVVPAFNESIDFIERFKKLESHHKNLLIVVANCPVYCDESARANTLALIQQCKQQFQLESKLSHFHFGAINDNIDLVLIDITEDAETLLNGPQESGVGFARKIGTDTALCLWYESILTSPWIYSTDADAYWPDDYLDFAKPTTKGAIVLPFTHKQHGSTIELSNAAALYDISLRYYVLGLRWAGSPWAYHTVGSILLIHAESYAEIRGFPSREAGEDFYLLNKAAKTAPIYCLKAPYIGLSDRASERVPFGTGPAVKRIQQQENPDHEFMLYNPRVFILLRYWHETLGNLYHEKSIVITNTTSNGIKQQLTLSNSDLEKLWQGLHALGLAKALNHAKQQSKNQQQFTRHLLQWFDGFRTLKLIHWLRENGYSSISYEEWQNRLVGGRINFITPSNNAIDSPRSISYFLSQMESSTLPFLGGL